MLPPVILGNRRQRNMMTISMIYNKDRLILRCEVLQLLQITLKANTTTYVHSGGDTV